MLAVDTDQSAQAHGLVFQISEDAYANGDATFTVSVDGKEIGGIHSDRQSCRRSKQSVTLKRLRAGHPPSR
jgi:hypothetical protein